MSRGRPGSADPPRTLFWLALLAVNLGGQQSAPAAGFGVSEWGAGPMGMANAYYAIADTPAAVVLNPAGLVQLQGLIIEAGVTVINPSFGYAVNRPGGNTRVTVEGDNQLFPVPALYAAYRLHERIAVGLGLYSMFGLGIKWPTQLSVPGEPAPVDNWGRSQVEEIELKTVYISPAVAIKLHERIHIGGGLSVVQSAVSLRRAVTTSGVSADDAASVTLSADDLQLTGNAGLLLHAIPGILNLGFTWRGGATFEYEGDAVFTRDAGIPAGYRNRLHDSEGRARLPLPHQFSFGVAAFPTKALKVGLGLDIHTWSSYKTLNITLLDENGVPDEALSQTEARDWENTMTLRVGAEYRILPQVPLRIGLAFDQSPAPKDKVGIELPDADRYQITLGAGFDGEILRADVGYMFLLTGDNESTDTAPIVGPQLGQTANYSAHAHLIGVSLGCKFEL